MFFATVMVSKDEYIYAVRRHVGRCGSSHPPPTSALSVVCCYCLHAYNPLIHY